MEMIPKNIALVLVYLMFIVAVIFIYESLSPDNDTPQVHSPDISEVLQITAKIEVKTGMAIAAVACGNHRSYEELLIMVKSAILFQGSSELTFIIFCEPDMQAMLALEINRLIQWAKYPVSFYLLNLWYPEPQEKWKTIENRMLCTCQRLFLPTLLPGIKYILYVDTDVIFLHNVSEMWNHTHLMGRRHIVGMTLTTENPDHVVYYKKITRVSIYGKQGLNSGVMLMDLDKMRAVGWVQKMVLLVTRYWFKIHHSDQDLVNMHFHNHPNQVYILPCQFNYRLEHCQTKSDCENAIANGIYLLHGRTNAFGPHRLHRALFSSTFDAFLLYEFSDGSPRDYLLAHLKQPLKNFWNDECHEVVNATLRNMERQFSYFDGNSKHHSIVGQNNIVIMNNE